ncbi:MAG: DUF4384 domain-containing protein [Planctomycetaceae bacterium]|nr:DUF4384 domain-containing protein [Planctomycetales bacterium]MCB9922626.1 DUF4384 domain-containing protein [Planctomycetaceae bacterium]
MSRNPFTVNSLVFVALLVVVTMTPARTVLATVEEAAADHIPWSGYWWPVSKGELLMSLGKYDVLAGKRAMWWELENHPPGPLAKPWHGYCHGWAAASVLEQEPTQRRFVTTGGATHILEVADLKALYSACHAYDPGSRYGDRFGDGENDVAQDMAPDLLWQVLRSFIRDRRRPLVFDLDPSTEVWNYPAFAYRIEYDAIPGGNGRHRGILKLWAADDSVPPEYVGTMPYVQTYMFEVFMRGSEPVPGSGRWIGPSIQNHPDFAWYPDSVQPENPELQYAIVQNLVKGQLVAPSVARNELPESPLTPPPNDLPNNGGEYVRSLLRAQTTRDGTHETLPMPISPLQLVGAIANQSSHFGFDARLLQFGQVRYKQGDRTAITGSSERAGYLYALHIDPTGELTLLYPPPGEDNTIAAQEEFRIPAAGQDSYLIRGPGGSHRIKVLVTERPLILTGLDRRNVNNAERDRSQPAGDLLEHGFRFFPTQERQIKAMLRDYVSGKTTLGGEEFDVAEVSRTLPHFAQDEIVIYVEEQ